MEAAIQQVLPRIVEDVTFEIHAHRCKSDLIGQLPSRLRAYSSWLPADWRIIVVVDRDNDACVRLKSALEEIAASAGLRTPSTKGRRTVQIVNRIAVEELEAWFFGDWQAVRDAYPKVSDTIPAKHRYRDPDAIPGGTWEALERILQKAGYFSTGLRKIEAAKRIAAHLQPARNKSKSFQTLYATLTELTK